MNAIVRTIRPGSHKLACPALPCLLLLLAALPVGAQEGAAKRPAKGLYDKAKQASVEILVNGHLAGSGWVADPQGAIITAAHVLGPPGQTIEVLSPVAGRMEAKPVAVDLGHDLALLSVPQREGGYSALDLAQKTPPPGKVVFMFGSAIYRHGLMLPGTVARRETAFEYYANRHEYIECTYIAADVQGGSSGGPWLNRRGQVVGMQSGMMSVGPAPAGISFMIPIDAIRALLKSRRTAATPTLGMAVEEVWQQQPDILARFPARTEGLVARILKKDGPAARAGLRQWDVIQAAEGRKVRLPDEFIRIVRTKRPGEKLKLTILGPDGTGTRELTVQLGELEIAWK